MGQSHTGGEALHRLTGWTFDACDVPTVSGALAARGESNPTYRALLIFKAAVGASSTDGLATRAARNLRRPLHHARDDRTLGTNLRVRTSTVRSLEMELSGIEPLTSWVRSRRSPS